MDRRTVLCAAGGVLLFAAPALAQTPRTGRPAPTMREIPRWDRLRKTLLDAVRPAVEDAIGAPVRFTVETLRTDGRFAYFLGESRQRNGRQFDFAKTKLKPIVEEGMFDGPRTSAYLERINDGTWVVRAWQIGSTDYPDPGWPEAFGGPPALVIGGSR
jgi:hypothetical protein